MDDERQRLYHAWRDATQDYWKLLLLPVPATQDEVEEVIERMDRTLQALMEHAGHQHQSRRWKRI